MKLIPLIIFLFMAASVTLFCFFILIRNYRVWRFRLKIIRMIYKFDLFKDAETYEEMEQITELKNKKLDVFESVDYNKMLYDIKKPVKLESWFSEKEIEILKS